MRCRSGLTQHGPSQIFHLYLSLFHCRVRRKVQPGKPVMSAWAYGWGHRSLAAASPGMSWGHWAVPCSRLLGASRAISHIRKATITREQLFFATTTGSLLSPDLGSQQKCLFMACSIVHPQIFSMAVHCLRCCSNPPASPNNASRNPSMSGALRPQRNQACSAQHCLLRSVCLVINSCTDIHSHKSLGCLTALSFN